jgi:hypothetical protein
MSEDEIGALIDELKRLKLRESRVIALLEAANQRNAGRPTDVRVRAAVFTRGDRVSITSRVRKPKSWPSDLAWSERLEKKATVTYVDTTGERVYLVTDNGVETWRSPSNLKHE